MPRLVLTPLLPMVVLSPFGPILTDTPPFERFILMPGSNLTLLCIRKPIVCKSMDVVSRASKRPLPTLFAQAPWKAFVENTERGPRQTRGPSCTCHSTNGSKDSSGTTDMQKADALLMIYCVCIVSRVIGLVRYNHPPGRSPTIILPFPHSPSKRKNDASAPTKQSARPRPARACSRRRGNRGPEK